MPETSTSRDGRCNSELGNRKKQNFREYGTTKPYENESQTTRQYSSEAMSKKFKLATVPIN